MDFLLNLRTSRTWSCKRVLPGLVLFVKNSLNFKIFFQLPLKLLENSLFFGNFIMVWEECGIGCGGGREAVEFFSLENYILQ